MADLRLRPERGDDERRHHITPASAGWRYVGFDLWELEASDFGTIGRQVKGLGLPTLVVQEGGYAIEAIGDCLDAFLGGFK